MNKQQKRVLLVEDVPQVTVIQTETLKRGGYDVIMAATSAQAVTLIETGKENIDLILLDINLGHGLDGPLTAETIQKKSYLPIVFFTSQPDNDFITKTQNITVYGYIPPNAGDKLFFAVIENAFKLSAEHRLLGESEMRMKIALEGTDEGLWEWHADTGQITLDDNWIRLLGYEKNEREFNFAWWQEAIDPDCRPVLEKAWQDYLEGKNKYSEMEYRIKNKAGEWRWVWARGVCLAFTPDGQPLRMIGTHRDITNRKLAEAQIKQNLEEKELLMNELQHRVKNNLNVISSLLALEERKITDEKARAVFSAARNRVRSMMLIYKNLGRSRDISRVNLRPYIEDLAQALFRTYNIEPANVELNMTLEDISMDMKRAVPLGLILNELLANALKHAFPAAPHHSGKQKMQGQPTNRISLELFHTPETSPADKPAPGSGLQATLLIKDSGIGLPENLDALNLSGTDSPHTSMGLQLVNMLVQQVNGTIELTRNDGTEYRITFRTGK